MQDPQDAHFWWLGYGYQPLKQPPEPIYGTSIFLSNAPDILYGYDHYLR
jgi:hypothetical protein